MWIKQIFWTIWFFYKSHHITMQDKWSACFGAYLIVVERSMQRFWCFCIVVLWGIRNRRWKSCLFFCTCRSREGRKRVFACCRPYWFKDQVQGDQNQFQGGLHRFVRRTNHIWKLKSIFCWIGCCLRWSSRSNNFLDIIYLHNFVLVNCFSWQLFKFKYECTNKCTWQIGLQKPLPDLLS